MIYLRDCLLSAPIRTVPGICATRAPQHNARHVQVAGFSGTNDNKPLLPQTVKAMASENPHIQATDGRMLCMLAFPDKCTVTLLSTPKRISASTAQQPVWSGLLDLALQEKAHALIDAGAFLSCNQL